MVSIKLKFRSSTVPRKGGRCFIQLIHQRKVRTIPTGIQLKKSEWNFAKNKVNLRNTTLQRSKELIQAQEMLQEKVDALYRIVNTFQASGKEYTASMIVQAYHEHCVQEDFFKIMVTRIEELKKNSQLRTAYNYQCTMRIFQSFCKEDKLPISGITDTLMKRFEFYLRTKGNSMNTISFYMRILRATYNYAVAREWVTNPQAPFKGVYTGVEKTVKRALDIKVIRSLIRVDLTLQPRLDLARDLFLFSIYMRGMSFVDLAHLHKENIHDDVLVYRRRKTNQQLQIRLPECAKGILDKYATEVKEIPFLLPVLHTDSQLEYDNALRLYNRSLKKLADLIGMKGGLTSYVARHSWATLAKSQGIRVHVISEALGHTSEQTTRIYLDSINNRLIDQANDIVINALLKEMD